jgi:hypothetical protein
MVRVWIWVRVEGYSLGLGWGFGLELILELRLRLGLGLGLGLPAINIRTISTNPLPEAVIRAVDPCDPTASISKKSVFSNIFLTVRERERERERACKRERA